MTRAANLAAVLQRHQPADSREAQCRARVLAELDHLAEPFSEEAQSTHVTASAIVVSELGVLLHLHRRLGMWMQPGGHIEADETPEVAAAREVLEETGIVLPRPILAGDFLHVDVHNGGRGHTHLDIRYLCVVGASDPRPAEGESREIEWFDWDKAIEIADVALVGALLQARRRLGT